MNQLFKYTCNLIKHQLQEVLSFDSIYGMNVKHNTLDKVDNLVIQI